MEEDSERFWVNFIRAIEAEPREAKPIRGASGLSHPVVALGVDDNRGRVVVVSGDPDARSAALAQADVQAVLPSLKVIFARPIALNLAKAANAIISRFGRANFRLDDITPKQTKKRRSQEMNAQVRSLLEGVGADLFQGLGHAKVHPLAAWQDVILQLSHMQIEGLSEGVPQSATPNTLQPSYPTIKLGGLAGFDPAEMDRRIGICSFPLYALTQEEAAVFHKGSDLEEARTILKKLDIFQYFFPPVDHLTLALVDANLAPKASTLVENLQTAIEIGHPLGEAEIITPATPIEQMIEALQSKGLCVEGELGYELTESGRTTRATVRFKPREGFLAKLSRVLSLKVDLNLKDVLK